MSSAPPALSPFFAFAGALRANAFSIAPEQTQAFVAATGLLGPRSMADLHHAAVATLAPPPERRDEFDALFRMIFFGQSVAAPAAEPSDEDEVQAYDARDGDQEPPQADEISESGAEATAAELLATRRFGIGGEEAALIRLRRTGPARLPRRRSRRYAPAKGSGRPDFRRTLREAVRRDGEVLRLPVSARKSRQRRILLLVDVSGSMKAQTDSSLRFAHALRHTADRFEAFTLGTRLTRITRALRHRNREQALNSVSGLVADWDGGTRLGDALEAFLSVPRFAGFARGAMVVVLSDGLERGDPTTMRHAVERLSRLAWKILWLTPLAGAGPFRPQTEALRAVEPYIDRFGGASSAAELCHEVLDFSARAA